MHDRNRTFRTLLATLAVWIIVAMSATLAGCTTAAPTGTPGPAATVTPDVQSSATVDRFRTGEVQNYKGQNLDPAIGPSDNSISGIQHVDISVYRLVIDGSVGTPASLTYDEVLALAPYERKITLHCVTGWSATILWKGVLLDELIQKAGPKASAVTVVFSAEDGYTTSLPLALIR
jgi:DMSO/TMAO reductase YedYZ molybdopterin-dependent catalytic subunit